MQLNNFTSTQNKVPYRVLVAEDCPDSRMLITEMLEQSGLNVSAVSNGKECVEGALDAWRKEEPFDVILMDIQMPEMDGHTAARALRANGYTFPIVAMTARSTSNDEDSTIAAGCNAHISKLIGGSNLIAEVIKQVQSRPTTKSPAKTEIPLLPIVPEILKQKPEYARSAIALLNKLPLVVDKLRSAVFRKDFNAITLLTIELGSASMLGYTILGDYLREMQKGAQEKLLGEINALMPRFERVTQEMLAGKSQVEKIGRTGATQH
jgi:CheY-like chemotaxis protein